MLMLGCGAPSSRREVGSTIGGGVWRLISCGHASTSPQRIYTFVAPSAGLYRFTSRTAPGFDGVLALWNPATQTQLGCNDDVGGNSQRSELAVELQAGETIEVIQSGYGSRAGEFELGVSAARDGMSGTLVLEPLTTPRMLQRAPSPPPRPVGPQPLLVDTLVHGDTQGAERIMVVCPAVAALEEFHFVPPATGHYLFRVDAAEEVYLSVLDAAGAELGCGGEGETRVQLAVPLQAGVAVRVMVGGRGDVANPYALLATPVSLAMELEVNRAALFDTGHADTATSACGAAPGSVDRELTFAPRAEGLYVFALDLPAVVEVSDGRRRIACMHTAAGERNAIFLKARHRYSFVIELGPSPTASTGTLRLMQTGASSGWSQTSAPIEAMLPLAP